MVLMLFLFWIILNGRVTVEIVLIGAVVSAALACFAYRVLHISPRTEARLWRRLPGVLFYLGYLVWQVLLSNLQVIRVILKPGKERPKLVWFRTPVRSGLAQLALANSITLTPGTVTAALGEDRIAVYALRPDMADGLKECGFTQKLRRLEGKDHG